LLIAAIALLATSMTFAHSAGGSSAGGHSGGGSSGGGGTASGSHNSGHSTGPSSSHRATAVAQGRIDNTSHPKKRWFSFGHHHVMHIGCLSEPAGNTPTHNTDCETRKKP
jgi:hypothetical protein